MGHNITKKTGKKEIRLLSKRIRTFSSEDNEEYVTVLHERKDIHSWDCKTTKESDLNGNICLTEMHECGGISTYIDSSCKPIRLWKGNLLSVCLFFLNLCIICIITFEVNYIYKEFASSYDVRTITDVIIPCDDMSLSYDEDEETFNVTRPGFKHFTDETGRSVCSFENLTAVIEKVKTATRFQSLAGPRYLSCGNVKKAPTSGYLTAYFTRLSRHRIHKDRGNDHLLPWDSSKLHSYIGPGISYHNGKIRVNVTQDYFVYAFVTSHQGILTEGRNYPGSCLFTMWVFKGPAKYDREFERIQLKSTQMLHNATSGIITSHVGSHVHLNSKEEIYVKVNDANRLVQKSSGNGFGIFPLL